MSSTERGLFARCTYTPCPISNDERGKDDAAADIEGLGHGPGNGLAAGDLVGLAGDPGRGDSRHSHLVRYLGIDQERTRNFHGNHVNITILRYA